MRGRVHELVGGDRVGLDRQVAPHREEAEDAVADRHLVMGGLDDIRVPHDRNAAAAFFRREEVPVAEEVTGHRIADVVRGECEAIDLEPDLAVGECR
jgi:hypothetical protein